MGKYRPSIDFCLLKNNCTYPIKNPRQKIFFYKLQTKWYNKIHFKLMFTVVNGRLKMTFSIKQMPYTLLLEISILEHTY